MIALWFGCEGGAGHGGHGYHPSVIGGRWSRNVSPWGDRIDSGDLYPGPEGVARLHHFEGVDRAYEERQRVVRAASKAGLSTRAIGGAVGMSSAGVWKILQKGGHAPATASLDGPAALGVRSDTEGGPSDG